MTEKEKKHKQEEPIEIKSREHMKLFLGVWIRKLLRQYPFL